MDDRNFSVHTLSSVAGPVLIALADEKLKATLPTHDWEDARTKFAHLEAFGRTVAGIAPWLELGPDNSTEGNLRAHFIELTVKSLAHATDPKSPDFMNFNHGRQPLVDAAFLAIGLIRAPNHLWGRLDAQERKNVVVALKSTRALKPHENNWLLFSASIEAALWKFTGECELKSIQIAIERLQSWYLGDGNYGDGPEFHGDYYNSFVIHPMLLEVVKICADQNHPLGDLYPNILARAQRYAVLQERMISPEGTFPVIGRSSAYRFGALQLLVNMALLHELPHEIKPAAVRAAVTAVINRMIKAPETFSKEGWLQVGAVGHQPSIREDYISTGSLYLCLCGLLHLGLPADDPFWTMPTEPWTQKKIWSGSDVPADHAFKENKKRIKGEHTQLPGGGLQGKDIQKGPPTTKDLELGGVDPPSTTKDSWGGWVQIFFMRGINFFFRE